MKSIRHIVLFVLLGMLAATSAQAQNRYFSDGENGLLLQFVGGGSEYMSSLGGGAMATLDGRFDFGFSYVFQKSKGYTKLERGDYTARLGVAFTRPTSTSNWGVDLWGAYTWLDYLGDFENVLGGTAWAAGADISLHLPESQDVRFIPTFGIGFVTVDSWSEGPDSSRLERSSENVMLGLELSLFIHETVVVAPQLTLVDEDLAWAITLGAAIHGI